ncbi:MAG: Uma2 family endonuclease [Chloroflexota bacterium]
MALSTLRPQPGTWTWEDLRAFPDDGVRRELIAGEVFVMTGPTPEHADAVRNLMLLLAPFFRALGMTFFTAPLEVFFPDASPVQPDLFALERGGDWSRSERGIEGAPALIIEVLSPTTSGKDRLTKRALYQQAGVREYWLADPAAGTVEILVLDNGVLVPHCRAAGEEPVRSRLLPAASFPAAAIFRDGA